MSNVSRRSIALVVVGLIVNLAAYPALAYDVSIRCGTHLIHAGGGDSNSASIYEVLKKCGEPEEKVGNTWYYIQGSMVRVLTFHYNGRLYRIESHRK